MASIGTLFEDYLSPDEIERLGDMLAKLPGVAHGDDACATVGV